MGDKDTHVGLELSTLGLEEKTGTSLAALFWQAKYMVGHGGGGGFMSCGERQICLQLVSSLDLSLFISGYCIRKLLISDESL